MKRFVLLLALVHTGLPAMAEEPAIMTLTGRAEVAAAPDMATIRLGVVSEDDAAARALAENSAVAAEVLAALAAAGIDGADVQTSQFRVEPIWDSRSYDSGDQRVDGFRVTNEVAVRVRDLDRLGAVLDAVAEEGANSFRSLGFGLQDPAPLRDEARRAAVTDARHRAALYAEAAGVRILGIRSIQEAGGDARPEMMAMAAAPASRAVPVAGGEVTVSATVTIVFEIGN